MAAYERREAKRIAVKRTWEAKVVDRKAALYFRQTAYRHDSGFRLVEVGYCSLGKGKRVTEKFVVMTGSDHLHSDYVALCNREAVFDINIDLTVDGYFRIWSGGGKHLMWEGNPCSCAAPQVQKPNEKKK